MRRTALIIAALAASTATPALAQIGVGGSGSVAGGVQVDTSRTVGSAGDMLGRTVDRADGVVNRTVDRTVDRDLRVATSTDVTAGASVRDRRGSRIGTVARVQGDTAIVVSGGRSYHVPLAALYRGASGLVSNLSSAELRAAAAAGGSANVRN